RRLLAEPVAAPIALRWLPAHGRPLRRATLESRLAPAGPAASVGERLPQPTPWPRTAAAAVHASGPRLPRPVAIPGDAPGRRADLGAAARAAGAASRREPSRPGTAAPGRSAGSDSDPDDPDRQAGAAGVAGHAAGGRGLIFSNRRFDKPGLFQVS